MSEGTPIVEQVAAEDAELLKNAMWVAKSAPCSCLYSAGSNAAPRLVYECPRCAVIRQCSARIAREVSR